MKSLCLKCNVIFSSLSDDEIDGITRYARPFNYTKDAIVFMQGDPSRSMFFLEKGRIKISKISHDGRKFTIDLIESGGFFGELSLAGEKDRNSIAETTENSAGLEIDKVILEKFLARRPDIAIKLIQVIGDKRLCMERLLENMIFMDVPCRIVSLLMRYSDHGIVTIPLTHQEIADMTGTTRVSVSRTIVRLRKEGLIETSGERIKLNDLDRLNKFIQMPLVHVPF
ncbi:MAG: Crp/Fnr family transcriptional regulator [Nitrospirae bacterium]|nr:Crp/Fnr family transcriptional regulator [Nitrospirota bacterium]